MSPCHSSSNSILTPRRNVIVPVAGAVIVNDYVVAIGAVGVVAVVDEVTHVVVSGGGDIAGVDIIIRLVAIVVPVVGIIVVVEIDELVD
jgi:hypothetical protein